MSAECWADPLNREQRNYLAKRLGRACSSFWAAMQVPGTGRRSFNMLATATAEMADLRIDVTERAAVIRS